MRYILIFVVLVNIVLFGVFLATDGQRIIVLVWNGYDIRMSLGIALIIVSAAVTVFGVIWAMMFGIVRLLSR
ncbi:putative membrane-anchored protein [Methylorubrum rhodinum]|uniref:Putative membrane-anchored protein n=1 Tax=Methylorubrum rhodinum TaxID=29428 RepID=A0A840ZIZ9_9HYPH|nr:hypothetical protein [Methylorubrum rhodinum]MBB5756917.1 putative membrane-anchored protein [Methylorubrum rhodinum]